MPKDIGHIKNPLTVIAIFAGIAETSGTIVLPLLDKSVQELFVWFLMLFPCLLIGLFFGVLYKKHHVLYAPSDYQEDKSFVDLHFTAQKDFKDLGNIDLKNRLPGLAVSEAAEASPAPVPVPVPEPEIAEQPRHEEKPQHAPATVGDPAYDWMENIGILGKNPNPQLGRPVEHTMFFDSANIPPASLQKIARNRVLESIAFGVDGHVQRDVQSKHFPNIRFDAVIDSSSVKSVVEFVEMTSDGARLRARIKNSLKRAEVFWDSLSVQERSQFVFRLAIMHGPGADPLREEALKDIADLRLGMPFNTSVTLYEYDEHQFIAYDIGA